MFSRLRVDWCFVSFRARWRAGSEATGPRWRRVERCGVERRMEVRFARRCRREDMRDLRAAMSLSRSGIVVMVVVGDFVVGMDGLVDGC